MSNVLHVGNLGPTTADYDLEQLFAPHGSVRHAAISIDQPSGRTAGTGIVEMGCDAEAEAAIAALNGHDYRGQLLVVARATGRQKTNAAHTSMFEAMNIPDASEVDMAGGPRPGDFGDRGGKGTGERR